MTAHPEYLPAMKCLAMRIGAQFHDEEDARFLLRLLDVRSYAHVLRIITKYYPLERFAQKTVHALEDLLPQSPA
jgi:2-methylcitrate dehydratase PrpD